VQCKQCFSKHWRQCYRWSVYRHCHIPRSTRCSLLSGSLEILKLTVSLLELSLEVILTQKICRMLIMRNFFEALFLCSVVLHLQLIVYEDDNSISLTLIIFYLSDAFLTFGKSYLSYMHRPSVTKPRCIRNTSIETKLIKSFFFLILDLKIQSWNKFSQSWLVTRLSWWKSVCTNTTIFSCSLKWT
jgi:hypothetical protein